ncbi:MAG: DUF6508 domain-containing protein [Trichloromonas sp.]|jgi:hypothetical protein|nr:DUF6508 domain-containing protein [Trichloromonas sp.]
MAEINYAGILKFLPRFEAGEFANAKAYYLDMGLEPQPVPDLMSAPVQGGMQIPFDWPSWKVEAKRYRENPVLISSADLATL